MTATRFGWGERVPFLSRIMLPQSGAGAAELVSHSLVDIDIANLLLVNASLSLDGRGVVLHLREIEGDHAILDVTRVISETGATSIELVNVMEESLELLNGPLLIEHFETAFVKLNFDN